jgi:sensor histidine kinase YesM
MKMFSLFRKTRLVARQFIFLFISSLIVLASLAWNTLNHTEEIYRSKTLRDAEIILSRSNEFINSYLDNVQNILLQLSFRKELFGVISEQDTEKILREYVDSNSTALSTLYLIRNNGTVVSSTQLYFSILGNDHLAKMVDLAKLNYGGINWSEPYQSPISQRTMAFVAPVSDNKGGLLGVIVMEIELTQLSTRLSKLLETETQTFTVLSSSKSVVASNPFSKLIPPELRENGIIRNELIEQWFQLPIGVSEIEMGSNKAIAMKSNTNRLGWSLISIFDESSFYRDIRSLYTYYRDAAIFWVLFLFVGSLLISHYFTSPIKGLVRKMDRVRNFELQSPIQADREDEIGDLARSYNAMMERIRSLRQEVLSVEGQKRDYEIRMLQSQIGPHFLYNTLACIDSLAYQEKLPEVQETLKSLIGILSLSIGKQSQFITLAEELQGLSMFTQIQNIRYGKAISLHFEVEQGLEAHLIPRLTLQPIVENAIFHGIVPTGRIGFIRITIFTHKEGIRMYIRDNGIGMEEGKARMLMVSERKNPNHNSFNSLGIYNVHNRLQLYYGALYGLKIRGRLQKGTVVRVLIPKNTVH